MFSERFRSNCIFKKQQLTEKCNHLLEENQKKKLMKLGCYRRENDSDMHLVYQSRNTFSKVDIETSNLLYHYCFISISNVQMTTS